jgi:hypothetical protein
MLGNVGEWTSTSGDSLNQVYYILGGYYSATNPNDGNCELRGYGYGGDGQEGFRVFGIAQ